MERTQVVVPPQALERQRDFTARIAAHHGRGRKDAPGPGGDFGCQQNVADSQRIMGMLRDMGCGFTDDPHRADIIVINTCAIRENAEKRGLRHPGPADPHQGGTSRAGWCACAGAWPSSPR